MSLRDEIGHRLREGRLFKLLPMLDGDRVERTMLVSEEVHAAVNGPWDSADADRMARLRADLDNFTEGAAISISQEPFRKPKTTYLARTHPPEDEVWDIRSRDPKPGIRVLGRFAEKDVFIALVWNHREALGGPGSKEWRDFIERCKAEWRRLFPTYPPHSGRRIDDYVSEDFYVV
jgi:hypothetical protein